MFRSKTLLGPNLSHFLGLSLAAAAWLAFMPVTASAQQLAPNQTHGFGNGQLVTFTYLQNLIVSTNPPWTWISTA